MKRIVLIGDSIRMSYQEGVRERLADIADVWGPEENGGTSENVLAHLDEWAVRRQPDVVHVNCGLHDIRTEPGRDASVPLDRYTDNVRSILARLRAETDAAVVWALTTPVNEERHNRNRAFDRFERDVVACNTAASEIARELGVAVDDLHSAVVSAGTDNLLSDDGVHFTVEGCAFLADTVAACLRRVLESSG